MSHARFSAPRCEPTGCKQADQCARTTFRPRGGEPKVIDASVLVPGGGWCSMFLDRRALPLLDRARAFSGAAAGAATRRPPIVATSKPTNEDTMPDTISAFHFQRIKAAVPPVCGASLEALADELDMTKQRVGVCARRLEEAGEVFTVLLTVDGVRHRRVFLEQASAETARVAEQARVLERHRAFNRKRNAEKRAARHAARGPDYAQKVAEHARKASEAARAVNEARRIAAAERRAAEAAERARQKQERERAKLEQKAARKAELDNRAAERLRARVAKPTTAAVHVAAARGPAHLPGDPDLSKARVTVAPTPPGRFEVRGRVLDGFAAMRPGCYELPANSCAAKTKRAA